MHDERLIVDGPIDNVFLVGGEDDPILLGHIDSCDSRIPDHLWDQFIALRITHNEEKRAATECAAEWQAVYRKQQGF